MQINGYTLIEPPFKGGMAFVYKGVKGSFARAFKFVRPDKAANAPRLVQQFLQEIKLQTSLDHPNIVKILDAYPHQDANGMSFTVLEMEWLNGLDLQHYVEQKAKYGFTEESVINIALQVLDGLQYAHAHNILHLDIKPSNLFLTTDNYVKIIDFGIAKVVGENAAIVEGVEKLTLMTETGESTFKGTLAYASPEQQVGGKLGFYSDIYSFGRVLHFLCTGSTDPSFDVKSKKIAEIIIINTPKPVYEKLNKGSNNSLVFAGILNIIKSNSLSKEIEKVFDIIAINNRIGIIESNKKKDRCPGKTETTGFLETSYTSLI